MAEWDRCYGSSSQQLQTPFKGVVSMTRLFAVTYLLALSTNDGLAAQEESESYRGTLICQSKSLRKSFLTGRNAGGIHCFSVEPCTILAYRLSATKAEMSLNWVIEVIPLRVFSEIPLLPNQGPTSATSSRVPSKSCAPC